ncbi:MAG: caspase family protein, partial [Candidatus Acidiferrales bacterium]
VGSGWDGSTHLWDVATRTEIAKLVALDQQDWAVVDPIGRFDASPGGMDLVHWVVGNEPIAAHQLEERYFDPGLLAKLLGFGEEKPRDVSKFDRVELFPGVQFEGPVDATGKLRLKLVNRGGGIGKVQVFVNDKELVADARGSKLNPNVSEASITVNLASAPVSHGRPNTIRVVAWNEEGYLASPGDSISWTPSGAPDTRAPEFYAIISGISNYTSPSIQRLMLPDSDAEEMAHALQLGANRMFGVQHVHITVLSTSHHAGVLAPTKENLKKAFEEAQHSKVSDVFVVYLAGHGVAVDDLYAYPTVEAPSLTFADHNVLAAASVTSEELVDWIKKVPARHQVMILDTCAAGAAAEKLTKRGMSGDQVRAIERLKDRTGFYVLMGSAADAASYEASQYGHGFLTYALLQGMKGAALKEGGFVDVDTLFQYAEDDVPVLARDIGAIQKPLIAAPQANSFEVGRLLEADKAAIHLASIRPMLERPVLLNVDEGGDTLQLVAMLRRRLRDGNYSPRGEDGDDSGSAIFVDKEDVSGAILPSGTYTVQGKQVTVKIGLWRDGKKLGTLSVSGTTDNLRELVDHMAAEISEAAQKLGTASGASKS